MDDVLVLGSGGREHALAEKLKRDDSVGNVFCGPGNGGTSLSEGVTNLEYCGFEDLAEKVDNHGIDFIVVGPEKPLANGITDYFAKKDVPVFGFRKETAQLEASKCFADEFKEKYKVKSPEFRTFSSYDEAVSYIKKRFARKGTEKLWIKADELCGGKGVLGARSLQEGKEALSLLLEEKKCGVGERVIIQDHVVGEEITVQAITDGESFVLTPSSQDHKPIYEGDKGPNTGGMGAYSPAPAFDGKVKKTFQNEILRPTADGLEAEKLGGPGVIYFGLRLSEAGKPKVLEYNVRFGDPEAQAVLNLLESDLYPLLKAATQGRLNEVVEDVSWKNKASICVVLSVEGYPQDYGDEDYPIEGIEQAEKMSDIKVYHSGTAIDSGTTFTDGGRVLSVTATGNSVSDAQKKVYEAIGRVHFKGMYFRSDIGDKAIR